jgi:hypothetical protein
MNENYIKECHAWAKVEADVLRAAKYLPPTKDGDFDVLMHTHQIEEELIKKFQKGAKEHGGSIHDRDPLIEAKSEVLDLFHYLSAAQNRISALKAYYTSPDYEHTIVKKYLARENVSVTFPPSSSQMPPVGNKSVANDSLPQHPECS